MANGSGLSAARLQRMHDVLAGHVERGELTGLVTLIARHGEVQANGIGTLTPDGAVPGPDTIFRIASMSKPVAAAAAMILIEECRLRLDDPVDELLPELAGRQVLRRLDGPLDETVPAEQPIRVRDLLTFTSGLGMVFAEPGRLPLADALSDPQLGQGVPAPDQVAAPDEWMARLGKLPLAHQPGTSWLYNTSADILSVLIARAAGQPLEAFLAERVFGPLGMTDTGFSVPAANIGRLATSWTNDADTGAVVVYDEAAGGQWSRPPAFPSLAGGLVSTAHDYYRFADMLRAGGRHGNDRLLSRMSVDLMTSDRLTDTQKAAGGLGSDFFDNQGWGYCMSVVTRRTGPQSAGAYGWDGGLGTCWRNDPAEDATMILLTQQMWSSPAGPSLVSDFWTLCYQALDD
ncbi:MAG TPA: serine hydrolase domain-containing protein [Streptosporangiaceae bacterium]